ncbi:MAG: transketolase [Candidatus Aegiribacteria sp.]|nr:transketolase [Candidatus Aegiribacteria sp.]MBD3294678.1 transketolase [Candidatus Fermentibacteria bacterium]
MTGGKAEVQELESIAREVRLDVLKMIRAAGSGHPGGSFSAVEILVELYWRVLRIRPAEPDWADRDRFVLSKGHACPALYSVLARRGYFPQEELLTLRKLGSRLQGHPSMNHLEGLDASTGSLGQGLSISCGIAHGVRLDRRPSRVYCLLGDGELQEGNVWEAAMTASHYNLSHLTAIVDRNRVQLDGHVSGVMEIEPLVDKWLSFGWDVIVAEGHSFLSLAKAFQHCRETDFPSVLIAKTVKGKGVSFMEDTHEWHGKCPNPSQYEKAVKELKGGGE